MQKLFMLNIALANLVASGEAEIVGMNWQIELGSGNTLFIEPSDEGFVYQILHEESEVYKEYEGDPEALQTISKYFTDREELICVSQLQDLINEVVD
jgi:hypothetical protein